MGAKLTYPDVAIPEGRTYVVTGGNGGIGYETSKYIAKHGGRVIIACRSEEKALTAIEQMKREHREETSQQTDDDGANTPNRQELDIEYMQLELSSLDSTMEFINAYKSKGFPLDVLICNAGIAYVQYGETADGYEQMFQVNYLSHHLIILHLLPLLKRSSTPNSRIVMVSSLAHTGGAFNLDNMQGKISYSRISFYNHSKLYQVMSMYSLARRLHNSGIGVFSLHPGVVETGIINNMSDSKVLVPIGHAFMKMFHLYRSPYQGSATTLVAALDPTYDGETALYFDSCKPKEPIALSKNVEKQEALWKYSADCLKDYITEQQIADAFSTVGNEPPMIDK